MKINEWMRLKEVEGTNTDEIRIGELFLMGEKIIAQKDDKVIGQEITYYKLLNKKENSIEYVPIYDRLEEGF